jgi:RecA-family ATPase
VSGDGAGAVLAEVRGMVDATVAADVMARYGIVRASAVAEKATEWEWPGYIVRGAVNLIEGNPETGKTMFVLGATANVSSGRPFPTGMADPKCARRVLYLTAEDSIEKTVVGRLKAAKANLENVLVQRERGADLAFAGNGIEDVRHIVRGEGIGLIVLDPLNSYLDGVDVNKEQEVRSALRPMRDFAEDENVTIVGLRHLNKDTDKPAMYRGGGSIALTAIARSTLLVAKHPDDPELRVVLSQKCNLIEAAKRPPVAFRIRKDADGRPYLEWQEGAVEIDADALLGPAKPGPKPDTLEAAKRFLTDYLASGPKRRQDVIEAAAKVKLSERAVERAMRALAIISTAAGKERLWRLPL